MSSPSVLQAMQGSHASIDNDPMVIFQEGEVERIPQLSVREQEPQASIRHVQSRGSGRHNAYGNSAEGAREASGSGEVGAIAENTVERAGSAHAGHARSTLFRAIESGLTTLGLGLAYAPFT